jgi:hypothetical protein
LKSKFNLFSEYALEWQLEAEVIENEKLTLIFQGWKGIVLQILECSQGLTTLACG